MKYNRAILTSNQVGLKYGFRSGLEIAISQELDANSVKYEYEKVKLTYVKPQKAHSYTPDFYLKEQNIFIETKGLFTSADRQKCVLSKNNTQIKTLDLSLVIHEAEYQKNLQQLTQCGVTSMVLNMLTNIFHWSG